MTLNLLFSENIGVENHFKRIKKNGNFRLHIIAFSAENLSACIIAKLILGVILQDFDNLMTHIIFGNQCIWMKKISKSVNWFKSYATTEISVFLLLTA